MRARGLAIAGLVVTALTLSGCIVFQVLPTATQLNTIGEIRIIVKVCASGSSGCADKGNIGENMDTDTDDDGTAENYTGQALLAIRIPAAATPPAQFTTIAGRSFTFTQSPSYGAAMEAAIPAGSDSKWVGYVSNVTSYNSAVGSQSYTAELDFGLQQAGDGTPFQSPFRYRPVAGFRVVDSGHPADRPVLCNTPPDMQALSDDLSTLCSDSPAEASLATTLSRTTRDLGIQAGGAVGSSVPSGTVSIPFIASWAGSALPAGQSFMINASTNLPGGTALPTPSTLAPTSNSANPINVAVGVPADATPGDYGVTLTANLAGGQTRTGTGTVTVLPPSVGGGGGGDGGTEPKVTIVLPNKLSLTSARRSGISVLIGSTVAERVSVKLFQRAGKGGKLVQASKPLASRNKRLNAPGPVRVTLRSNKLHAGRYRITVAGNQVSGKASGKISRR